MIRQHPRSRETMRVATLPQRTMRNRLIAEF
jgi:hypothetical protein